MKPIHVLLADDHSLVRAGIRSLLESMPDVQVVGEAQDGRQALSLIEQYRPDVVMMDVAMPGMNGLEALTRVTKDFPQIRVIILSMHANEEYVLQALHLGAAGYLLKDAAPPELELGVRAVARGETYFSPPVSKHVVADYLRRLRGEVLQKENELTPFEQLTARQREVLQLIAEGHTNQEIAQILKVSLKTIETHRTQLMERLDIHDVVGLVHYAIRRGLVKPDENHRSSTAP